MNASENPTKRPSRTEIIISIVMIMVAAAVLAPFIRDGSKQANQARATGSARQLGMALYDFREEYGRFPDRSTAPKVIAKTGTLLLLGEAFSNDYFRQLIAAGITQSEEMFYAKTPYTKKADNIITATDKALGKGEVGFGYLMIGDRSQNVEGNPGRPIAVTPLLDARADGLFDRDLFEGKAVALRMDNSVTTFQIRPSDNRTVLRSGKTLLETGDDTVWGASATPRIAPPLKK